MTTQAQSIKKTSTRIRENRGDRIFNFVNYTILTIFFIVVLYPLIYVVTLILRKIVPCLFFRAK
ncbi:MAG: hypothetical protein R6W76_15095 [Caldilinea sp.]